MSPISKNKVGYPTSKPLSFNLMIPSCREEKIAMIKQYLFCNSFLNENRNSFSKSKQYLKYAISQFNYLCIYSNNPMLELHRRTPSVRKPITYFDYYRP